MAYGDAISQALPTPGVTVGPDYANDLLAWCQEVETCIEAKVTPAGININADLSLASNGLTNADHIIIDNNGTSSNNRSVYVASGELYYKDGSGNAVQLTSGGNINIAGAGGFTGDYSGDADAEAKFIAANKRYEFYDDEPNQARAGIGVSELRLYGAGNNPTYVATIDIPALSANETYTLPSTAPAATSVINMDSSGNMGTTLTPTLDSVTGTTTLTLNGASGITLTHATTCSDTLTVTNELTYGTDLAHGQFSKSIDISSGSVYSTTGLVTCPNGYYSFGTTVSRDSSDDILFLPLNLKVGDRIQSFDIKYEDDTTGTFRIRLRKNTGASVSTVGGTDTTTGTGSSGATSSTITPSSPETVATGVNYFVEVYVNSGSPPAGAMAVYALEIDYDRP